MKRPSIDPSLLLKAVLLTLADVEIASEHLHTVRILLVLPTQTLELHGSRISLSRATARLGVNIDK